MLELISRYSNYIFWFILASAMYIVPVSLVWLARKQKGLEFYLNLRGSIWKNSWMLISGIVIMTILLFGLHHTPLNVDAGDRILHIFGGGLVVSIIFEYWKRNLAIKMPWYFELIVLYFVVCAFGTANELLEFFLDQSTRTIFSPDRLDTWWDLLSNTLGAILGWLIWQLAYRFNFGRKLHEEV